MKNWRLILSPPSDGATNMAVDEAFFNLNSGPTLRFYSWTRPTLSVGRFQRLKPDFTDRCNDAGIDLVRRPTGGRALLHDMEITYSVSAPYDEMPGSPTLTGIYRTIARWQIDSLARVGVNASLAGKGWSGRRYAEKDACFLTSTSFEVNVGGRKISGSAQRRGKDCFLQHGSILIDYDFELLPDLFSSSRSSSSSIPLTTLKEEGCLLDLSQIVDIMTDEFEKGMECNLIEGALSMEELKEVERLKATCMLS